MAPSLFIAFEKSQSSLKRALRKGQTVVWFNKKLLGKSDFLIPLINSSLSIRSASYIHNSTIVHAIITNNSDAPYILRNQSEYDFYNTTNLVMVPPHGEAIIDVRTIDKKRKFEMQFEVLNALSAPNTHPVISITVKPKQ
jgi:hypothetical protein